MLVRVITMDYAQRLIQCGLSVGDAWMIVNDYMTDGDLDGLISFIERRECCSPDVVEEVLSQIGLEKIQQ